MNLLFLDFGKWFFQALEGLYNSVGKMYDLIKVITENVNELRNLISPISGRLYLLIGIFMIFRIGVSLIQYLVDPDKINDKQEGGGKLISRVLISIVLIFTFPLIVNYMTKIEDYLVSEGGITTLIDKLFDIQPQETASCSSKDDTNIFSLTLKKITSSFILDVNASTIKQCIMIEAYKLPDGQLTISPHVAYVTYYRDNYSSPAFPKSLNGYTNNLTPAIEYNISNSKTSKKGYVKLAFASGNFVKEENINEETVDENGNKVICTSKKTTLNINYSKPDHLKNPVGYTDNTSSFTKNDDAAYQTCPIIMMFNNQVKAVAYADWGKSMRDAIPVQQNVLIPISTGVANLGNQEMFSDLAQFCTTEKTEEATANFFWLFGLSNSTKTKTNYVNNTKCRLDWNDEHTPFKTEKTCHKVENPSEEVTLVTDELKELEQAKEEEIDKNNFNTGLDPDGGAKFARGIFGSFLKTDGMSDWFDVSCGHFLNYDSSHLPDDLAEKYQNSEFTLDWLLAIVTALAVMVFIIILLIDVVVRGLKLVFLELIAPIPIMCYMNPKDKIFNEWIKMYFATFADLFMKLLGIEIAIKLLNLVWQVTSSQNGLIRVLFVFGIFLFAKAVPDILSKVFGIKVAGGSFGQAAGLVKKGLGLGAGIAGGAIAGGIAGAATGMGHGGRLSSVLGGFGSGMMRGAAGGTKGIGGIKKGISTQYQHNKAARASNAAGGNWRQRALSKVNMDAASRTDRSLELKEGQNKLYDQFAGYEKAAEEAVDSTDFMKDLRQMVDTNGNSIFTNEQLKEINHDYMDFLSDKANSGKTYSVGDFASRLSRDPSKRSMGLGIATALLKGTSAGISSEKFSGIYQTGKAVAVQTSLSNASAYLQSNSTISNAAGTNSPVTNYADLHTATSNVKSAKTANERDITAAKATSQYSAADASRNKGNNK